MSLVGLIARGMKIRKKVTSPRKTSRNRVASKRGSKPVGFPSERRDRPNMSKGVSKARNMNTNKSATVPSKSMAKKGQNAKQARQVKKGFGVSGPATGVRSKTKNKSVVAKNRKK